MQWERGHLLEKWCQKHHHPHLVLIQKFTRNRYVIYTANSKAKKLIKEETSEKLTFLCESFSGVSQCFMFLREHKKKMKNDNTWWRVGRREGGRALLMLECTVMKHSSELVWTWPRDLDESVEQHRNQRKGPKQIECISQRSEEN